MRFYIVFAAVLIGYHIDPELVLPTKFEILLIMMAVSAILLDGMEFIQNIIKGK